MEYLIFSAFRRIIPIIVQRPGMVQLNAGHGPAANPVGIIFLTQADMATMVIQNAHPPTGVADLFMLSRASATRKPTAGCIHPGRIFPEAGSADIG